MVKFLSPLGPLKRHLDIRSSRVKDTGTWILEAEQFQSWQSCANQLGDTSNRVLCCYGDPGTGKTFLRYATLPPSNLIAMTSSLLIKAVRLLLTIYWTKLRDTLNQQLLASIATTEMKVPRAWLIYLVALSANWQIYQILQLVLYQKKLSKK